MIDFAELLKLHEFDEGDRPPAGTECVQCRQFGHFCPAKGYVAEYPLCLPCGRSWACEQLTAVDHMERDVPDAMYEQDRYGAPGECRQVEITDADRMVTVQPEPSVWTLKASLDPEYLKRQKVAKKMPVRVVVVKPARAVKPKVQQQPVVRSEEVGMEKMSKEDALTKALELRATMSAAKIATVIGFSQPVISKWFRAADGKPSGADLPAKSPGSGKTTSIVAVVDTPAVEPEMVSVRLPAAALDRLIAMMPVKVKVAAMEKLLAEI